MIWVLSNGRVERNVYSTVQYKNSTTERMCTTVLLYFFNNKLWIQLKEELKDWHQDIASLTFAEKTNQISNFYSYRVYSSYCELLVDSRAVTLNEVRNPNGYRVHSNWTSNTILGKVAYLSSLSTARDEFGLALSAQQFRTLTPPQSRVTFNS